MKPQDWLAPTEELTFSTRDPAGNLVQRGTVHRYSDKPTPCPVCACEMTAKRLDKCGLPRPLVYHCTRCGFYWNSSFHEKSNPR